MTRLQIAENFLHDAVHNEMSARSREDCAFNAGYLFALEAVPATFTEKLEHPSRFAVRAAARCLGLNMKVMEPAFKFIREQYSLRRDGSQVDALLAWALLMKKSVSK